MTTEVTDKNFQELVMESKELVLIDFWAPWCGPCKAIAPILDQIENEMGAEVKIMKINIDENPESPTKHAVRGIPTMMLFKDGKHLDTKVGMIEKSLLSDWINSNK